MSGHVVRTARAGYVEERRGPEALPKDLTLLAAFDKRDVGALKALLNGTAQPHQQQRALAFWMHCCGVDDDPFVPGDALSTAYCNGRQRPARQVRYMLGLPGGDEEQN